jgi:hypothetical protein
MHVAGRITAGAIFDENALDALARNVRQLVLVDEGHLGILRLRRLREDAAEWQGGDKQRTEDAFHGALLRLADDDRARAFERLSHSSKPVLAQNGDALGGADILSEAQRQLARRCATIAVACERLEGQCAASSKPSASIWPLWCHSSPACVP